MKSKKAKTSLMGKPWDFWNLHVSTEQSQRPHAKEGSKSKSMDVQTTCW